MDTGYDVFGSEVQANFSNNTPLDPKKIGHNSKVVGLTFEIKYKVKLDNRPVKNYDLINDVVLILWWFVK